jgi:hypothetical protein
MTLWFHSTILATSIAATVAVGIASAAIYSETTARAAPKSDRMPIAANSAPEYLTVETRGDGVSVLSRIPAGLN